MISIIVITHGEFGAYLVEAAESIVGPQEEAVKTISVSPRMSLADVHRKVAEAVGDLYGEDGLLCLVDMAGGTPMNTVLPLIKDKSKTAAVCGININMVISAFSNRKKLSFEKLVDKIVADGRKSILEAKGLLIGKN